MDNLPATTPAAQPPATKPGALQAMKTGGLRMLGKARTEVGEAIQAAGVSVEKLHQRLILVITGLMLMLFLGALFRSWDMPALNYLLIALFGLGALFAFLQPVHVVGVLLVSGGVAAVKGMESAGDAVIGYGRILGRVFLAFLVPLLLFALAPGDRSLGSSLPLLVLAPIVVLAIWVFGRVSPKLEKTIFVGLPLIALTIALANMLIPERALAGLGIPAWLRTGRPQDDELAKLETALERQRNERLAEQLRAIRAKLDRGEALNAADEAVIRQAQRDRVTLTSWFGDRYNDLRAQVSGLAASTAPGTPAGAAPPAPGEGGSMLAPTNSWSAAIAVPAGQRLCASSEGEYRMQCHPTGKPDAIWHDGTKRCSAKPYSVRFRATGRARQVSYRFVPAGESCD